MFNPLSALIAGGGALKSECVGVIHIGAGILCRAAALLWVQELSEESAG